MSIHPSWYIPLDERYSADELSAMPTLSESQADSLKVERLDRYPLRVWLSRCGVADGEPYENKVTHETRTAEGQWVEVGYYEG